MSRGARSVGAAGAVALALALFLAPGAAIGERAQEGNLIVSLNGGISPLTLPRDRAAPVGLRIGGRIRTSDGSALPQVKRIELALTGRGRLFTRGLPVCPRARILNATGRQAMARCGAALVGTGTIDAAIFVPHQKPFPLASSLRAFNGRTARGGLAVWVHAYSADPPVSIVLPFVVHRRSGRFRTALVTTVPRSLGPLPHFAGFQITFSRRFRYRGELRSYLSASCPAPKGFTAGFLSFARATYRFTDGRSVSAESVRSCRAR